MDQNVQPAFETPLPDLAGAWTVGAGAPGALDRTGGRPRVNWEAPENAARLDAFVFAMEDEIHVPTTLYNEGRREMRNLRDRARRGERGNVFVIGGLTGAGKSWLLDRNLLDGDFPDVRTRWADPMPVLRLDAPSPGRMKALIVKMLSIVSGYEVSDRPSEPMLMRQFLKVARERGVRVIKIDEFQHIVNLSRTDRHERTVSETLKTLLNETDIQLVLAGEPSVLTFFDRWKQFERRGSQLPMTPFAGKVGRAEFTAFLEGYDQQLADLSCIGKFIGKSDFAQKVDRFQLATGGYVGLAAKLIRCAAEMSYKAEEDTVDETLAVAYERWRRRGDLLNPFLMNAVQLREAAVSGSKSNGAGNTRMRGTGGIAEPTYGK
ncbi:MAG: TniB family NTP-binding protein [Methylobacterium sp.]|uniref:TniB family NTP-binding protein n=1 Tax=Methylobacterium sp. TaxID=409 RepID=UPI0025D6E1F7|nr:TniB family NTP-binding protein [Methylobacterium sp.]MBX9933342.1 TniB family NTP-binding protein [Methylobacterium sp.]